MIFWAGMKPTRNNVHLSEPLGHSRTDEPGRRRRRRWTAQQKADLLARLAESGLTTIEFGRQAGITSGLLRTWSRRQRMATDRRTALRFARVRLADPALPAQGAASAVVQIGADITLSVPPGTDPCWLGQVVRAVRNS